MALLGIPVTVRCAVMQSNVVVIEPEDVLSMQEMAMIREEATRLWPDREVVVCQKIAEHE